MKYFYLFNFFVCIIPCNPNKSRPYSPPPSHNIFEPIPLRIIIITHSKFIDEKFFFIKFLPMYDICYTLNFMVIACMRAERETKVDDDNDNDNGPYKYIA